MNVPTSYSENITTKPTAGSTEFPQMVVRSKGIQPKMLGNPPKKATPNDIKPKKIRLKYIPLRIHGIGILPYIECIFVS